MKRRDKNMEPKFNKGDQVIIHDSLETTITKVEVYDLVIFYHYLNEKGREKWLAEIEGEDIFDEIQRK